MKISGIYAIINKINNKMYIGKSENCYGRWLKHRSDYMKKDSPLYNDMRNYGIENFYFKVIDRMPIYLMEIKKQEYIKKYNSSAPNGYN